MLEQPGRANGRAAKPKARPKVQPRPHAQRESPESKRAALAPDFWKHKTLEELNPAEWESLCDGCGRCCLVKLEDADSGAVYFTDIGCRLFDPHTCRCTDYAHRQKKVHDCIRLTPAKVRSLGWLPPTCAYRLVAEGRDLPWWHPLISGTRSSVHEAGVSVRNRVRLKEGEIEPAAYQDHIVAWPGKRPYARRRKPAGPSGSAKSQI